MLSDFFFIIIPQQKCTAIFATKDVLANIPAIFCLVEEYIFMDFNLSLWLCWLLALPCNFLFFWTVLHKRKFHEYQSFVTMSPHFSFGQFNEKHWLRRFWQHFFARRFTPRPRMLLKFGQKGRCRLYLSCIQHQTRSRSEMSGKKLMSNNVSAEPSWTQVHYVATVKSKFVK